MPSKLALTNAFAAILAVASVLALSMVGIPGMRAQAATLAARGSAAAITAPFPTVPDVSRPTIRGTATGVSQVIVVVTPFGTSTPILDQETVSVVSGQWSAKPKKALPDGRYGIWVYMNVLPIRYSTRLALSTMYVQAPATQLALSFAGPEETVYNWSTDHCASVDGTAPVYGDYTDEQPAAYRLADGSVGLLIGNRMNIVMRGPTLNTVKHVCTQLLAGGHDPDPAHFADNEWLEAVAPIQKNNKSTGQFVAYIHDEYHGDMHASSSASDFPVSMYPSVNINNCKQGAKAADSNCIYEVVSLAYSSDGGKTFTRYASPSNLLVAPPMQFSDTITQEGTADPKLIKDPHNGHMYMFVTRLIKQGTTSYAGQCLLMNSNGDGLHWQMWNGSGFSAITPDPYSVSSTTALTDCTPITNATFRSIKYIKDLNTFIALGRVGDNVGYWLSPDLIHWGPPTPTNMTLDDRLAWQPGDPAPTNYYSLLDPTSNSPQFDTINSTTAYLYFVRWDIVQKNGTTVLAKTMRDVIRVPITLKPPASS
jgi:hypothetical protein